MAAEKYITINDQKEKELRAGAQTSAGAGSGGKLVALNDAGKVDDTMLPDGIGADVALIEASENMTAPCLVDIWNDSGTPKVRYASAASPAKPADGYLTESVTSGNEAKVHFSGVVGGFSGLAVDQEYYLGASNGQPTATPTLTSGTIHQSVGYGVSATELRFEKGEVTRVA